MEQDRVFLQQAQNRSLSIAGFRLLGQPGAPLRIQNSACSSGLSPLAPLFQVMEEEKEDQGFSTDVGTPIPAPAKEKKADAQGEPASSSSSSLKSDVATADNLTSWVCRAYDKASAIPDDIRHRIHSLDELLHFLKARRNDLRNGSLGDKIRTSKGVRRCWTLM